MAYSFGDEACELMRRAGRPGLPWQEDSVQMMLGVRADGMWACSDFVEWAPRQNGKGWPLEARVLAGLLLLGEELIMWSAHEVKTAEEMRLRVIRLVRALGVQPKASDNTLWVVDGVRLKIVNSNGKEGINRLDPLPSGVGSETARCRFIARSKGSGRGFSGDLRIIDEAYEYDESQEEAQEPTGSARPNPQTIYASTPPLSPDTGRVMYKLRRRGDPTAPRNPSDGPWQPDPYLGYRDWGAGGDLEDLSHVDLDDEEQWARFNPSYGLMVSREAVHKERIKLSPAGFARERYAIWPRRVEDVDENAWKSPIPAEKWQKRAWTRPDVPRPREVAYAIVVNAQRTQSVIGAVGPLADGRLLASLVDVRPGTGWIVDRMLALKKHRPVTFVMQDRGPVASLLPDLRAAGFRPADDPKRPPRGCLTIPTAGDVAAAYGMVMDAVDQDQLWHLDEEVLNRSVRETPNRPLLFGSAWDYKGEYSAPINAVTLAAWGFLICRPIIVEREDTGVWVV